jgi:predicted DCC family thiol-disulfide oxidoreductase YuxK
MTAHPVIYDPDCGFCRVCVAVILRWDRHDRLHPVPGEDLDSWQLIRRDGTVLTAGDAFPDLFRLLPGGAPMAWLTERFRGPANRAYWWVADHRSALGRPIPDRVKRWADRVISESERRSR